MEEYISHEDYKKMLGSFGKQTPKSALNEMHTMEKEDGPREFHKLPADVEEGLEKEGNAFTAGLAKTKKGGEFKVGNKKFKDKTNYDAPMNEYQFDQMYPDDPGPFENSNKFASFSDDHGWFDDKDRQHKDFDFDYDEEEYNDLPSLHAKHGDTNWFAKGPEGERFFNKYKDMYGGPLKVRIRKEDDVNWDRMDDEEADENETDNGIEETIKEFLTRESIEMEEDINLPSSQPTGPSIEETRRPLSHLSAEERDQLRQYVETIRTVKEEINKMINKSGMEEGGNMTNLIMRPNTGNIRK